MIRSDSEGSLSSYDSALAPMYDPINYQKFKNPIICPHGHTFEKGTLLQKVNAQGVNTLQCSVTGEYFPEGDYRINYIVKDLTGVIEHLMVYKRIALNGGQVSREEIERIVKQNESFKETLKKQEEELSSNVKKIDDLTSKIEISEKNHAETLKKHEEIVENQNKKNEASEQEVSKLRKELQISNQKYDLLEKKIDQLSQQKNDPYAQIFTAAGIASTVSGIIYFVYKIVNPQIKEL